MTTVTLERAQQDLPVLIRRALAGEEIVIEASRGAAVRLAPIVAASDQPVPPGSSYRGRGALKGQLIVGPEFFEPLSDERDSLRVLELLESPPKPSAKLRRAAKRHREIFGRR